VYDADSLDMLFRKMGTRNVLFGSEMFGTAKALNPDTGRTFDDIIPLIEASGVLTEEDKEDIFWRNAVRVYPRLKARLSLDG